MPLSALEAPGWFWAPLLRGGFLLADVLIAVTALATAVAGRPAPGPHAKWWTRAWGALAISGAASTFADSSTPGCQGGACESAGAFVHDTLLVQAHSVASVLTTVALLACMAAVVHVRVRGSGTVVSRLAPFCLGGELVCSITVAVLLFTGGPVGIPQCPKLAIVSTWLALLAVQLWRER